MADKTLTEAETRQREADLATLAARCGKTPAFLAELFHHAFQNSCLDFIAVISRMKWLLDPKDGKGLALGSFLPDADAQTLARHVVHPRDAVLRFIRERSGLPLETLSALFDAMRHAGDSASDYFHLDDLSTERILQEMKWWIVDLKFPAYYFQATPPSEIAKQILTNRLYEMQGSQSDSYAQMKIHYRSPSGTTVTWAHREKVAEVERELEGLAPGATLDLATYTHDQLHLFLSEAGTARSGASFEEALPASFLNQKDTERTRRYRGLWEKAAVRTGMHLERSFKAETGEHRLMVAFRRGHLTHFLTHLSQVLERRSVAVTRKYCVVFGGDTPVVINSIYTREEIHASIDEELSTFRLLGDHAFSPLAERGLLSAAEAGFLGAAALFVHQFLHAPDPALDLLTRRFSADGELKEVLRTLGRRVDKDRHPPAAIQKILTDHLDLSRELAALFAAAFHPRPTEPEAQARARFERHLDSLALGQTEGLVFRRALSFIDAVERTNFFMPHKNAMAFRLKRGFLGGLDFGADPFAVFFVVGRSFFGFHVRFKDIARGGIRILQPATIEDWVLASATAFDECYNLAATQDKKNKDIPEGGAKGILLPAFGHGNPIDAFKDYVDALLDLALPDAHGHVRNAAEELLFLGPDEGTADAMNWACEHARSRGYRHWKGFTTGKSARLGGVSHIDYGMTTHGIREYVRCLLSKLGLDEAKLSKVQTGGPDGDLGGNEILQSHDRTVAVVDGAGVLFDPDGLDRGELARLARERLPGSRFDAAKLGPKGYFIGVNERQRLLPDGTRVASGMAFRNQFHLDPGLSADLFVPCGGRPRSIHGANVQAFFDGEGRPKYRFVVEGANLFITQDARLQLEKRGVILFKDSSTNKGGVTSSSLEVLAGLALTDDEFSRLMVVDGDRVPEFRRRYVDEIIAVIHRKARDEFEVLWGMREKTGRPLSELSDLLSARINALTADLERSDLMEDPALHRALLLLHVPPVLVETVGIEALLQRIPEAYQRAILARTLSSRFIYTHGLEPGYEDYRRFLKTLMPAAPR